MKQKQLFKAYVLKQALPIAPLNKANTVIRYNTVTKQASLLDGTVIEGVDVNNTNFFRESTVPTLEVGDYVKYMPGKGRGYQLYTIKSYNYATEKYHIVSIDSHDECDINILHIVPVQCYWFINSEGKACYTYVGKNSDADNWRAATDNIFTTKDNAINYINEVMSGAKPDDINYYFSKEFF